MCLALGWVPDYLTSIPVPQTYPLYPCATSPITKKYTSKWTTYPAHTVSISPYPDPVNPPSQSGRGRGEWFSDQENLCFIQIIQSGIRCAVPANRKFINLWIFSPSFIHRFVSFLLSDQSERSAPQDGVHASLFYVLGPPCIYSCQTDHFFGTHTHATKRRDLFRKKITSCPIYKSLNVEKRYSENSCFIEATYLSVVVNCFPHKYVLSFPIVGAGCHCPIKLWEFFFLDHKSHQNTKTYSQLSNGAKTENAHFICHCQCATLETSNRKKSVESLARSLAVCLNESTFFWMPDLLQAHKRTRIYLLS